MKKRENITEGNMKGLKENQKIAKAVADTMRVDMINENENCGPVRVRIVRAPGGNVSCKGTRCITNYDWLYTQGELENKYQHLVPEGFEMFIRIQRCNDGTGSRIRVTVRDN